MNHIKFFWIVGGIFVSFFLFATFQEKLLKGTYGENDKFTFVMPLLCITSVVTWLYGMLLRTIYPYSVEKPIPAIYIMGIGLLIVLAMASSFMALQWVSYPAQVLAKSSKPIPVMIMGVLLGEKHYPLRKYFFVLLIVFGVVGFFYSSDKSSDSSHNGIGVGEVLLMMSLLMDGLVNSFQERILSRYKPNSNYLMMESNKWIMVFTLLVSVASGEGLQALIFMEKYPSTIWIILVMSICSAIGQFFIYRGINELGTLAVSLITTTRKFFTVLSSVIIFGHHISLRQWIAVVCVFLGLILDTYFSKAGTKSKQGSEK